MDELKFVKDTVPTPLEVVLMQEIERYEALHSSPVQSNTSLLV